METPLVCKQRVKLLEGTFCNIWLFKPIILTCDSNHVTDNCQMNVLKVPSA